MLVQALNALLKPDAVPAWLRKEVMGVLVRLPLRPTGVRATLEFVFSVHPSGTLPQSKEMKPEKRGANISHEALEMATQLITTVPSGVSDQTWTDATSPQLLHLLDGKEGSELAHVAGYVISFGVLGRKRFGAPGEPRRTILLLARVSTNPS
ncbi:hypothetical protein IMZ48_18905 [Candidatus Bathyarchaeota archaeon]|nr:hypothetical protein [Candidatus Bathyarchaeota archaeon]